MSWSSVYSYFNEKLGSVGCTEWHEAFDADNIPSTLIDKAFHQSVISVTNDRTGNKALETTIVHELRVFFKGFREPRNAQVEALDRAEQVILACVNLAIDKAPFTNVAFSDLSLEPMNDLANDNIVVAIIRFDVKMFLCA